MAKGRSVEGTLAQLAALKGAGPAVLTETLPKYLTSKINLIAAKAADLAREHNLKSLQPQLAEAFDRFMQKPTETDKGCTAKQAIANALYELGCDAAEVFLAGIRHHQHEGSYGPSVDTAAELRGLCALGLVRMAYRDVSVELVDLLVDPSHQTRIMAARALAYAGRDEGALLLRLKIRTGDDSDDVTGECLIALGNLGRAKTIPFIRTYLDSRNEALVEYAALSLGEMRHPDALSLLFEHWARDPFSRKALALPIALSRLPQSLAFLLKAARDEKEEVAAAVIEALRIYRHDDAVRGELRTSVDARPTRKLHELFTRIFAMVLVAVGLNLACAPATTSTTISTSAPRNAAAATDPDSLQSLHLRLTVDPKTGDATYLGWYDGRRNLLGQGGMTTALVGMEPPEFDGELRRAGDRELHFRGIDQNQVVWEKLYRLTDDAVHVTHRVTNRRGEAFACIVYSLADLPDARVSGDNRDQHIAGPVAKAHFHAEIQNPDFPGEQMNPYALRSESRTLEPGETMEFKMTWKLAPP